MTKSIEPTEEQKKILVQVKYPPVTVLCSEWINWAIDYLKSETNKVKTGETPTLVSYYNYCNLLNEACNKYLEGNNSCS